MSIILVEYCTSSVFWGLHILWMDLTQKLSKFTIKNPQKSETTENSLILICCRRKAGEFLRTTGE